MAAVEIFTSTISTKKRHYFILIVRRVIWTRKSATIVLYRTLHNLDIKWNNIKFFSISLFCINYQTVQFGYIILYIKLGNSCGTHILMKIRNHRFIKFHNNKMKKKHYYRKNNSVHMSINNCKFTFSLSMYTLSINTVSWSCI